MRIKRRKYLASDDGTVAIEYALILPIFIFMNLYFTEMFMIFSTQIIVENSVTSTLRSAKTGATTGNLTRDQYIRQEIRNRSYGLVNPDKLFITNSVSAVDKTAHFSNTPAENCLNPNGTKTGKTCPCLAGQTFEDLDNNGICDAGTPPLDTGAPGDVVVYTIIYRWQNITPIGGLLGDDKGESLIITGGAVRNEPF